MGLILTLLYVALTYLSPADLFPELAPYRIMLWLSIATAAVSIWPLATGRAPIRTPQLGLMLGFIASLVLSRLVQLWVGGAINAFQQFMTAGIVFFAVVANVYTMRRFRLLITVLIGVAVYLLSQSVHAYYARVEASRYLFLQPVGQDPVTGEPLRFVIRIKSLGILDDPNDFAQLFLLTLPFLFVLWERGRKLRGVVLVLLPAAYLLLGVYLTDSRGAMIGLACMAMVAVYGKVSRTKLAFFGLAAAAAAVVLNRGGREMSLSEGSAAGRVEAWGTGIAMLRSSPLFGTGFNSFLDHHERTAHNSYVLCFAELGLLGYFFWLALIVVTVLQLNACMTQPSEEPSHRWYRCMRVSLFGFLSTAWFLSRTYSVTLYLAIAMATALVGMRSKEAAPLQNRWARMTVAVEFTSILSIYVAVRLLWS